MKAFLIIIGALIAVSFVYGTIRDSSFSLRGSSGLGSGGNSGSNTTRNQLVSPILQEYANSPYAGFIELERKKARDEDPEDEYIQISADRDLEGQVNVTGWRVESLITGTTFIIPSAALIPAYPNATERVVEGPVLLEARHELYVVTARSPIQKNFRSSICTGYLENTLDFKPRLDRSCPAPEDENLVSLGVNINDEDCIRAIERVGRCRQARRPIDEDLSNSCREYLINHINYKACTKLHAGDSDFFGSEWYVYINDVFNDKWNDEEDVIVLFDSQNRVVDVVEYD